MYDEKQGKLPLLASRARWIAERYERRRRKRTFSCYAVGAHITFEELITALFARAYELAAFSVADRCVSRGWRRDRGLRLELDFVREGHNRNDSTDVRTRHSSSTKNRLGA